MVIACVHRPVKIGGMPTNAAVIEAPSLAPFLELWRSELGDDEDRLLQADPLCNRLLKLHDHVQGDAQTLVEKRLQANLGRTVYQVKELRLFLNEVERLSEKATAAV